ncbi:hypothetical protein [Marinitoga sp. 38H-ov]|uniref:hypothetical protein n=1 Tax=Marinitoga sp. 38H-ov TaxID=1755814 RepID=UPI0013EB1ADC|nr:hypothetical protein [Marinitoga sp. 38H-ov]
MIEFFILFYFFKLESFLIFLGALGAILGILMISEQINTLLTKPKRNFFKGYFIRYVFFGIILLIGSLFSQNGLFITFLGLLNMKFAALISPK